MGEPIPDRLQNMPEFNEAYQFYLDAFFELSSERQLGFGEGPIPTTAILNYCGHFGIHGVEESDFLNLIRAMDASYLKQQKRKNGKSEKSKEKTR